MNKLYSAGIVGIGSYIPERIVTNFDIEKHMDTTNEWIIERTGVHQRRFVRDDESTSSIATIAAQRALESAKMSAEEIDLIILASAAPDMAFPSTACLVQDNIKAKNAAAFDLSAGCSGFVYNLAIAAQFVQTGMYKNVMIIGSETLSKILNMEDRNTGMLFGDGAGAAVISRVEDGYGALSFDLGADGSGAFSLYQPAGGSRIPASHETVDKKMHTIHMKGTEVFKFATKIMSTATFAALEKANMTTEDIDLFVPHQANIRIIDFATKRMNIPKGKVMANIDVMGNTSAASIPIALVEAIETNRLKKGDNVLLVGFGAGLTWAACMLKWSMD